MHKSLLKKTDERTALSHCLKALDCGYESLLLQVSRLNVQYIIMLVKYLKVIRKSKFVKITFKKSNFGGQCYYSDIF